jgi:FKBP-type peptidyl-prolyl cis-trans isomerase SlyD
MAISENSVVSMEYQVMEADTKNVVDSNVGKAPLEFIIGKGQIIPGLESELMKLDSGEKADVIVSPENAYGEYNDEAVQNLPKEQFAGIELKEGMTLYGSGEEGQTVQVVVKSFDDEEVTIDYNHPLAGKTLMFTVTIMDVRAATEEEIATGIVGGMAAAGGCCGGGHCDTEPEHKHDAGGCCGGGHCS